MKKLSLFLKDAIKAIIGIPILIGWYEILNLVISVMMGEYVRLDGGVLQTVIEDAVSAGLMGYGLAFGFFSWKRIFNDKEKDEIQKSKSLILYFWIISIIVTILDGIILADFTMTLVLGGSFTIVFALATLVIYLWEYSVNNKKKEG